MVFESDGGVGKAYKVIESVLSAGGFEPDKSKISAPEGGAAWAVKFGSAAVMIALNPGSDDGQPGRVRVISPIVRIDPNPNPDMFKQLLALNGTKMPGVAFGLVADEIVLVTERSIRGLDRVEVKEMLTMIGHYADQYDDFIVENFGGCRVCDLD